MYTMEQAAQLAADFLRQYSGAGDSEAALHEGEEFRAKKGEFFYFSYQSVKYIATRDDRYLLYGPPAISVHGVTGECRFISHPEFFAVDPFNRRQ